MYIFMYRGGIKLHAKFFFSFPLNCFVISLAKKEHKMYKHNVLKKNVTRKGE